MDVEEVSAFKKIPYVDIKGASKGKEVSEEEEDFVDDYIRESSPLDSSDYVQSRESSFNDACDDDDALGVDGSGGVSGGMRAEGSVSNCGADGEPSYLRPRPTGMRRRPTNLSSVYEL